MKVGLFTDAYLPTKNGVVTAIRQLATGLTQRGHKVVIVTVKTPDFHFEDQNVIGLPSFSFARRVELRWSVPQRTQLQEIFDSEAFELVHTHTEFSIGWLAKDIAHQRGIPSVHTFHTFYEFFRHYLPLGQVIPSWLIKALFRRFLKTHDAVICPSQKAYDYLAQQIDAHKLYLVHNAVCATSFLHPAKLGLSPLPQLELSEGEQVLLYVGRLAQEKRLELLLETVLPLLASKPHCRLILVGDGALRGELEALVQKWGLGLQVLFVGWVSWEAIHHYYAIADVFVTASNSENHPMTLLEAMLSRLPLVAYDDPSLEALIFNGYNGCLARSADEFRSSLLTLLNQPALKACYGQNSAKLVQQFAFESYIAQTEALYHKLVASKLERG